MMKTIYRTYKFRLKPNSEQKILLAKHFGCARFVFNHFLAERQEEYKNEGKSSNYYNFEKQRVKVARLYEKVSNARKDYLHKVSLDLVRNYDVVCLEDLNIKGMMKNHRLARQISDVAWGEFVGMLTYKAEMNNKEILKIDRFYPSSKTCNNCGYVKRDLKLSDRKWVCPECGAILDRDVNAAMNILSAGLADYTCGVSVIPEKVGDCEARTPLIH